MIIRRKWKQRKLMSRSSMRASTANDRMATTYTTVESQGNTATYCSTVDNRVSSDHRSNIDTHLRQCMRFPTMWYVQPAKPLLVVEYSTIVKLLTELHLEFLSLKDAAEVSLKDAAEAVQVYTCQNATLLEITCTGSFKFY